MSKWTAARRNWTPTATADTTNLVDGSYQALQGANTTQIILVLECYMGGLATVQSPMDMTVAFDSTVATGTLGGSITNTAFGANITSLGGSGPTGFSNATVTKPQRSSSQILLTPAFNAFGGVVRWGALEPDERIRMVGNAAGAGEISLSAGTGSTAGPLSSHIVYEPT
jgi:hypothetical protein